MTSPSHIHPQYFPNWSKPIFTNGCHLHWRFHQLHYWRAASGFECCPQQMRLSQWEHVKLGHASFFNIILKWNWLHLKRHTNKSCQLLAQTGFISERRITLPEEHHLLTYNSVQHLCTMMEPLLPELTDWEGEWWQCKGLKVWSNFTVCSQEGEQQTDFFPPKALFI